MLCGCRYGLNINQNSWSLHLPDDGMGCLEKDQLGSAFHQYKFSSDWGSATVVGNGRWMLSPWVLGSDKPGTSPGSVTFGWDFTETCLRIHICTSGLTVQFGFPQSRAWDKDVRTSGSFGRWSRKQEGSSSERRQKRRKCPSQGPYWASPGKWGSPLLGSLGRITCEEFLWRVEGLTSLRHFPSPSFEVNSPALPGCTAHGMRPLPPSLTNQGCPSSQTIPAVRGGWGVEECAVSDLSIRMVINGMGAPRGRDQSRP